MIDIHTHILPYVDDGSPDLETSINLIKFEVEQGVTDIFVTPHYFKQRGFYTSYKKNQEIFEELISEVKKLNINVNLYLGNEVYYYPKLFSDIDNEVIATLNNSKYLLIEFSLLKEIEDIPDAINNITAKGYIPIIAHPERYPYLDNIRYFEAIKRMGAKIQINSGSINGQYGRKIKKFVIKLMENNLVDFVASDIHNFRYGNIKKAYEIVSKNLGDDIANKIFNNREIFK